MADGIIYRDDMKAADQKSFDQKTVAEHDRIVEEQRAQAAAEQGDDVGLTTPPSTLPD